MKNAFKVFKRDLISIIKSPVAILIVVAVCIIPSLYAWVNIKACWDPYENTSDIAVAVVNNDKGTTFNNENLNFGDTVIENLKENKKIGWKFVSSKKAENGVLDGTYYSYIEIPEDFSESLASLLSDNPKKATILYKVDTKANAVAVKITDTAKKTLVDEITTNFVATVNEILFSYLEKNGQSLKEDEKAIIDLKNNIINIDNNMSLITDVLDKVSNSSGDLTTYLSTLQTSIPKLAKSIENLKNNTANTGGTLQTSIESINTSIDNIQFRIKASQGSTEHIVSLISDLEKLNTEGIRKEGLAIVTSIQSDLQSISSNINDIKDFLEKINKNNNESIVNIISTLENVNEIIKGTQTSVSTIQNSINNGKLDSSVIDNVKKNISKIKSNLDSTSTQYTDIVKGQLNNIASNLKKSTDDAVKLISKTEGITSELENMLSTATDATDLTSELTGKLKNKLEEFSDIIKEVSDKLKSVGDNNISQIIAILQNSPEVMSDFMSDPFIIKEESIFSVPNYGSAMAPLYTVLALWVGGVISSALFKTEPTKFDGSEELTIKEKYFGKMMTFCFIGVMQGLIAVLGDLYLLKIYAVEPLLLVAFSIVTSLTFTIIIYTLVSLFSNLGKAIAIVFLIVQLAGSGASYPIQVNPLFFRIVQPFLPFTYAVGGFREAIAGVVTANVVKDFAVLFVVSILFIFVGYFLKLRTNNTMNKLRARFKESGLAE